MEEQVQNQKLSYEELQRVAMQLSEQAKALYKRVQELELTNMFKRLDYLFKVIENKSSFLTEFSTKCANEIQSIIDSVEEEDDGKSE